VGDEASGERGRARQARRGRQSRRFVGSAFVEGHSGHSAPPGAGRQSPLDVALKVARGLTDGMGSGRPRAGRCPRRALSFPAHPGASHRFSSCDAGGRAAPSSRSCARGPRRRPLLLSSSPRSTAFSGCQPESGRACHPGLSGTRSPTSSTWSTTAPSRPGSSPSTGRLRMRSRRWSGIDNPEVQPRRVVVGARTIPPEYPTARREPVAAVARNSMPTRASRGVPAPTPPGDRPCPWARATRGSAGGVASPPSCRPCGRWTGRGPTPSRAASRRRTRPPPGTAR